MIKSRLVHFNEGNDFVSTSCDRTADKQPFEL